MYVTSAALLGNCHQDTEDAAGGTSQNGSPGRRGQEADGEGAVSHNNSSNHGPSVIRTK